MDVQDAPTGCYKCGQPGHWSSDCPFDSAGGGPGAPDAGPSHDRRDDFRGSRADGRAAFTSAAPGTFRAGSRPDGFKRAAPTGPDPDRVAPGAPGVGVGPGREAGMGGQQGERGADRREPEGGEAAQGEEARAVRSRNKRKITPDMLLDAQDGIPALMRELPAELALKGGRGNELADLRGLLKGYMRWQKRVFPNASLVEFAEKVEKLGSSRHVKLSVRGLLAEYDVSMGRPPPAPPSKKARASAAPPQPGAEGQSQGANAHDADASAPEGGRAGGGEAAQEDPAAEEEWWAAQQGPDDDDDELEMEPPPAPAPGATAARDKSPGEDSPAAPVPEGPGAVNGGQESNGAAAVEADRSDSGGLEARGGGAASAADGAPADAEGSASQPAQGPDSAADIERSGPEAGSEEGRRHNADSASGAEDPQTREKNAEDAGRDGASQETASAAHDGGAAASAALGSEPEAGAPGQTGHAEGAAPAAIAPASMAQFVSEEDLQAFMDSLDD